MATLTNNQRVACWAEWMRKNTADVSITKADLRAAIDAADVWVDSNSTSYNTAIPQPARGALTASQKAAILLYVVAKRYELGV